MHARAQDNVVPVDALVPPFKAVRPSEVQRLTSQLLFPVNVAGDRQYYLSVQAGTLLDSQARFACRVILCLLRGQKRAADALLLLCVACRRFCRS